MASKKLLLICTCWALLHPQIASSIWGDNCSTEPKCCLKISSGERRKTCRRLETLESSSARPLAFLPQRTARKDRKYKPRTLTFVANQIAKPGVMKAANTEDYRTLYPPSTHVSNGTLKVDSIHELYFEEHGQVPHQGGAVPPSVKTALFLHGGPGAGCFPNHARFFDPDLYHIVLFDQRGSGRSSPRGETRNNTLEHLVQDCEALRLHLGIERWDVVLGGSWGTTLAIAYAQEFPQSVGSMVLRGVCLLRPEEVNWLFARDGGAAAMNPAGWKDFEDAVGVEETEEAGDGSNRAALHRYYDCFFGTDPILRVHATRNWMRWEMGVFSSGAQSSNGSNESSVNDTTKPSLLTWEMDSGWSYRYTNGSHVSYGTHQLTKISAAEKALQLRHWSSPATLSDIPDISPTLRPISLDIHMPSSVNVSLPPNFTADAAGKFVPAQAMLTCFYSVNDRFVMHPWDLLSERRLQRIKHIPCIAVQGGKDNICPPDTALDLLDAWREMELRIPVNAGHSMYDPAITSEIVKATDRMAGKSAS